METTILMELDRFSFYFQVKNAIILITNRFLIEGERFTKALLLHMPVIIFVGEQTHLEQEKFSLSLIEHWFSVFLHFDFRLHSSFVISIHFRSDRVKFRTQNYLHYKLNYLGSINILCSYYR